MRDRDSFLSGHMFGWKMVAETGLFAYLLLAPLWALGMGVSLLRKPVSLSDLTPA